MRSETCTINGLKHTLYSWGDPSLPVLFLIHGWMDSGANFKYLCEFLKRDFYCVAPDMRGHGQTEHTTNPLGYFFYEYLADLDVIFNKYAPSGRIRAVGHSMGGNILSLYAGAFPEKVTDFVNIEGLGIADMPPSWGPQRVREWLGSLTIRPERKYKRLEDFARNLRKRSPLMSEERSLEIAGTLLKRSGDEWVLRADLRHTLPGPHLYQLAHNIPFWQAIKARVLFIQGEKTDMATWMTSSTDKPEEGSEAGGRDEIEARLSYFPTGTQRKILKGCGHMVHYEDPEGLYKHLLEFLQ